jgi:hypothetical protein
MTRILAALAVLAALVLAPAVGATAAPAAPVLKVDIKAGQVRLLPDGSVSVPLRARCSPSLDAFEVDLSVVQGSAIGENNTVGGAFPACTGTWQQITLTVVPFAGTFTSGTATISVFLGAFDQVQGDLEARDSATVRLRL